ncbi:amidase [Pleurocapsales cyanobacterium LEGE 10410]|nr:amidase [Pleurocapsales cyanobacterium LEGE 10410]
MSIVFATASQLAQMIRDKKVSAVEVLDAYLEQIDKHNVRLNAIATLDVERARTRAIEADEALARGENCGVLHGVPITIKDTFETAGLLTTAGYKSLKNYVPQQDAIAVERLRSAGAVIMAKTNCASLAADHQTNNSVFGRTNNPWNLDYIPGGSTGGGAAAVAAGLSPLELGSDGGGSIRQPAHCCGIYGFKATDRLVPSLGHLPELPGYPKSIRHVLAIGTLARCVEDLQLCLSVIAGADSRQPEIPPVTLKTSTKKPLSSLRIAWTPELGNLTVDKEIKLALTNFVTQLIEAGCQVEQQIPKEFDCDLAWQTYGESYGQEILAASPTITWDNIMQTLKMNYYKTRVDRQYKDSPLERGFLKAFPTDFKKYMKALTIRDRLVAQMDNFLADWDAYLCPVSSITAFPHQPKGKPIEVNKIKLPYTTACGGYATLFNFTGHPVVVIPIGKTQAGLPIGVQIVGKRWQDRLLLAIAQKIGQTIGKFTQPSGY